MKHSLLFVFLFGCVFLLQCRKEKQQNPTLNAAGNLKQGGLLNKTVVLVPNPGANHDIQPFIQQAVNNARNGDEIDLPEGSFTISRTIQITKFISIRGAGLSKTILYRSETMPDTVLSSDGVNCIFKFLINSSTPSNIVVSDLCLKSKIPSVTAGDGGSLACDYGIKFINCIDFVITRCRFENFGDAAVSIQHPDNSAKGLVCKNQFFHNVKGPTGLELGYGVEVFGENKQWVNDAQFGSANFIFVEDNTFDVHRHAIAGGGCGLYVFRYNIIINNNIGRNSGQAIDAHEARQTPGANYYSTRAVEIYNNQVINTTFEDGTEIAPGGSAKSLVENAILIRGGEALIHDNELQGYRFGIGVMNFVATGLQQYPVFTQIGYASGLNYGPNHKGVDSNYGNGDLFAWNNSFTPYPGTDTSSLFYNYQPGYFQEDRDYHFVAKPSYEPYVYPHPHSNK